MLLRAFGARVGARAMPYPGMRVWAPWKLTLEDDSVVGDGVNCYNVDHVVIGKRAVVSQGAFLCSASHDYNDPAFSLVTAPIRVSSGAWVAAEAFIGPGVTLGEGAVVTARAVVVRDVASWDVVAGNPAIVVGKRQVLDGSAG